MENNKAFVSQTTKDSWALYLAIKNNKLEDVKHLREKKRLINAPIQTTGAFAGYRSLHIGCMESESGVWVKKMIEDYEADVNIAAEDGIMPIHVACILGNETCIEILLEAGANIEAKLGRNIFSKYEKGETWGKDFGEEITIFTYAVVYRREYLAKFLQKKGANPNIISRKNKTLLMYALENDNHVVAGCIVGDKRIDRKYLNIRDNDGYHALHYLFHPKKYGHFRYDGNQLTLDDNKDEVLLYSMRKSLFDLHAKINGDPDTLLINTAAYRNSKSVLKRVLPFYDNIKGSKALFLAEDTTKSLRLDLDWSKEEQIERLEINRRKCTGLILRDLVYRLEFGLFVPEGEKKLMDKLISTDKNIKETVLGHKRYLNGTIKSLVIKFDGKSLTYYDFIKISLNKKKLQALVRNVNFLEAYKSTDLDHKNENYFRLICPARVDQAVIRNELLDKLKLVRKLKEAIPLPYECVLEIIEFLSEDDLRVFINSFYTTPINFIGYSYEYRK